MKPPPVPPAEQPSQSSPPTSCRKILPPTRYFNVKCLLKTAITIMVLVTVLSVVLCGLTPALKVAADAASGWGKSGRSPALPDLQLRLAKLMKHTFVISNKVFSFCNLSANHLYIFCTRAVDSAPRGRFLSSVNNTVMPVYSTSITQMFNVLEFLQISPNPASMPKKGEDLLKEEKVQFK